MPFLRQVRRRAQRSNSRSRPPSRTSEGTISPVYLDGLGTVQAYVTVTVRSRVDGQITKMLFKQGQMVHEGDPLLEIDKRPYQAALDQAIAKKAQDEASLRDDKLNLNRFASLAKQDFASKQQLDTQQALVDQLTAQIQGDQAMIDNAQPSWRTRRSLHPSRARPVSGWLTQATLSMQPTNRHRRDCEAPADLGRLHRAGKRIDVDQQGARGRHRTGGRSQLRWPGGSFAWPSGADRQRVDAASGTISMKATLRERRQRLVAGLSVSTRMLVETLRQVIVVPEDCHSAWPQRPFCLCRGQ